jgi:hypothetical protein
MPERKRRLSLGRVLLIWGMRKLVAAGIQKPVEQTRPAWYQTKVQPPAFLLPVCEE